MSSNNPYINLTRSDYEEAFLLYVDGELDAAGMAAVESFVLLHPDLQEELDLLLSTRLDTEVVVLEGKEELLAAQMRLDGADEDLLLYIDGELTPSRQALVEARLAGDEDYALSYSLLAAARLSADKALVYPDKKELYRHTEKRIAPKVGLRIAAAVILLMGIGILWNNSGTTYTDTPAGIAQTPKQQGIEKNPAPAEQKLAQPAQQNIAVQGPVAVQETKASEEVAPAAKEQITVQSPIQVPDQRDRVAALHQPITDQTTEPGDVTSHTVPQQTINTPSVTTGATPAYGTIDGDARPETGFSHAVATSNDEKKGSVRGFLRKASRFIERRTGINPVNDDDELLIGAVALKLK